MDELTMRFNENQLKRAGFAEAFTPALQQQMKDGVPYIQHHHKTEYDGDKVDALLHLRKSNSSDHYFLNKFDLELQRQGETEKLKHTFYITSRKWEPDEKGLSQQERPESGYTLKKAYNVLAGRPVYLTLVSKEGNEYEAWVKFNLKNKLASGNYEIKTFTKNYGFDLENVLAKYPIKELANEKYKQSLMDSLRRGNLQKATFTGKDGKEDQLYISPNISMGALNIYDQDKKLMAVEMLIERQYTGKEMLDELKQRITLKQGKPQKQESIESQQPEGKQTISQKLKKDQPVMKQTKKQKLH